jgi:hypothetical protein
VRNAYLLIDFGSFIDEAPPGTNAPYIQLLPITDTSKASTDFAKVRSANRTYTTNDLSETGTSHQSSTTSKMPTWAIGAIVGGVVSLLLLGSCIYCCFRRRRATLASASTQPAWVPYAPQTYRHIIDRMYLEVVVLSCRFIITPLRCLLF